MKLKSNIGWVVVDEKGIPLWDFAGDTEGRAISRFMRMLPSLKNSWKDFEKKGYSCQLVKVMTSN